MKIINLSYFKQGEDYNAAEGKTAIDKLASHAAMLRADASVLERVQSLISQLPEKDQSKVVIQPGTNDIEIQGPKDMLALLVKQDLVR